MSPPDRLSRLRDFAEASGAAGAVERRNRPTTLVALAVLALAAGLVFAMWGIGRQLRAEAGLASSADLYLQVREKAEIARELVSNPARESLQRQFLPETQLRTKLQRAGDGIGLDRLNFGNLRDERFQADSPLVRKVLDVTLTGVSPELGLEWIDRVRAEIPGLEVIGMELRPDAAGWTFRVRVARWEIDQ